jgi:hypothetical protein
MDTSKAIRDGKAVILALKVSHTVAKGVKRTVDGSPFIKALLAHGTLVRCGLPVRAIHTAFSRTSTCGT